MCADNPPGSATPPAEDTTRRQLLRHLLHWAIETSRDVHDHGSFRIDSLQSMPDDALSKLTPRLTPDCKIFVQDEQVWATFSFPLFPTEQSYLTVFNCFDGKHTLAECAAALAEQTGWSYQEAFRFTRDLLIDLAIRQVCLPTNPPEFG
jgi:hypothetical protein